jgi:hypothetical protein
MQKQIFIRAFRKVEVVLKTFSRNSEALTGIACTLVYTEYPVIRSRNVLNAGTNSFTFCSGEKTTAERAFLHEVKTS